MHQEIQRLGFGIWLRGRFFAFRRSSFVLSTSFWLSNIAKLLLPFSILLQYVIYMVSGMNPLYAVILNGASLFALGVGQLFSLLSSIHSNFSRPRVRDTHEIRRALRELDVLQLRLQSDQVEEGQIPTLSETFFANVYHAACTGICSNKNVIVTFMLEEDVNDERHLVIKAVHPKGCKVDETFSMRLTLDKKGNLVPAEGRGAAAFAYGSLTTLYVPNTEKQVGHYVIADHETGRISYSNAGAVWFPRSQTESRAGSVLSVPVFVSSGNEGEESRPLAVLNFETHEKDGFADADYHLACTFANLLAKGLWATSQEIAVA